MRSVKLRGGLTRGRGVEEGTRQLWAMSLNDAAALHQAMNQLAGSTIKTTEQHVDLGHSRCIRDQEDWKRFKTWLLMRNPFEYNDTNLHSLASGFVSFSGKDEVNCLNGRTVNGWMEKLCWMPRSEEKTK